MSRILIIDDDAGARAALRSVLEADGHETIEAADGIDGLRLFFLVKPDLVITEIVMPHKEGIEIIIEILNFRPGAKIIALSGRKARGESLYLSAAKKLGAMEVISAPIEDHELQETVRRVLAKPTVNHGPRLMRLHADAFL